MIARVCAGVRCHTEGAYWPAMVEDVLAGEALLSRLRGAGLERPPADPEFAGNLVAVLEEAASAARELPPEVTVRVTKNGLRQVLLCEQHLVASLRLGNRPASLDLVRGRLLDRVFVQVAVGVPFTGDPVDDALAGALVAGDVDLVDDWDALMTDEQDEVRRAVSGWGSELTHRWPSLPANALVRFQEPLRVELAGGRIVLVGRVDLMLGRPSVERAGTTLIDVKGGKRRYDDIHDAGWYALLETIRCAQPFQAGNYYLRDGALVLDVVDRDWLEREAIRVADGVRRLIRLAAGAAPGTTPTGICPWCPVFDTCEPGRRHAGESGMDVVAPVDEDDEDDDDDF